MERGSRDMGHPNRKEQKAKRGITPPRFDSARLRIRCGSRRDRLFLPANRFVFRFPRENKAFLGRTNALGSVGSASHPDQWRIDGDGWRRVGALPFPVARLRS